MTTSPAHIRRLNEAKLISFVEDILGEESIRNRGVFEWLKGETGRRLRVDAYFRKHNLAIEYHGRQHFSPNKLMDRRPGRQEQRIRYDALRRELIPKHGIKFVEFRYDELITAEAVRKKLQNNCVI